MIDRLKLSLYVALLAVAMIGYFSWRTVERRVGAMQVLLKEAQQREKVANFRADSVDKVFKTDTLWLTKRIVRDTTLLRHIIDSVTVIHHDTVSVPVEVLVTVDSTLRGCRQTLTTCADLVRAQREKADALEAQVILLKRQQPGFFRRLWPTVIVGSGAYVIGRLTR